MARKKKWSGEERRQAATVLIAGDDAGSAELLGRILEVDGFRTVTTTTVDQASVAIYEHQPRCVVIDLSSQGIGSSMQLLDTLRSSEEPRVASARAIIVAKARSNRTFSFQSGADGFLVRPFHAKDLRALVAEVMTVPADERANYRRRMIQAAAQA